MAGETPITLIGNLTADPELRFTPSGAAVANFTVASTPRTFDRQTNEWRDGDAMFLNCAVWRQAAENVAESLQKGMRVIVSGRLKSRSYETREGEKRTVFEVDVDEIGPARTLTVTFLIPVFGVLWGTLFLNEQVTGYMLAGGLIVLFGTALANGLIKLPARVREGT